MNNQPDPESESQFMMYLMIGTFIVLGVIILLMFLRSSQPSECDINLESLKQDIRTTKNAITPILDNLNTRVKLLLTDNVNSQADILKKALN